MSRRFSPLHLQCTQVVFLFLFLLDLNVRPFTWWVCELAEVGLVGFAALSNQRQSKHLILLIIIRVVVGGGCSVHGELRSRWLDLRCLVSDYFHERLL